MNKQERLQQEHTSRGLYDLGFVPCEVVRLRAIERSLHLADERSCNVDMDDRQQGRHDRRVARLESEAETICADHGCIGYHQCDPRGGALVVVPREKLGDKDVSVYYPTYGIYV